MIELRQDHLSTVPSISPAAASDQEAPGPPRSVSRRGFLRTAAVAGGGLVAVGIAACAPAASGPAWTFAPTSDPGTAGPTPSPVPSGDPGHTMAPSPGASMGPDHDANALEVVKRFLAGEWDQIPGYGNQPLAPRLDGDVKVFEMTIDQIEQRIDSTKTPLAALGFNKTWPGPRLEVVEGDRVRVHFKNNLDETTGIHFHGQHLPNPMDGVPHITQDPIQPGETFTYEFTAKPAGSHMYHSHHNATDQVGRGLLGAFIVQPKDPALRYDALFGATQDIIWISNDALGGFTINGRGFPATAPIVATLGEKIVIRFMNEGNMMHPWHVHGVSMRVVARDGFPLGPAAFTCDTLGVNPGERWDVVIDCDNPGAWAFHCHILTHAEGRDGMFGMVTALIIQDPATASTLGLATSSPIATAALAAGSTAALCRIAQV